MLILNENSQYSANNIHYNYTSAHNIVHFQGNVDVQIVPKNACSTLKSSFVNLHYADALTHATAQYGLADRIRTVNKLRELGLLESGSFYRANSERYAIYRDPLKRALSGAVYLLHNRYKYNWNKITPSLVNEFLQVFDYTTDIHMSKQIYWLGKNKHFFDRVFYINDTRLLLDIIQSKYDRGLFRDVTDLHANKSKVDLTTDDLDNTTIDIITKYYRDDYEFIETL